jgi:plastocyanin
MKMKKSRIVVAGLLLGLIAAAGLLISNKATRVTAASITPAIAPRPTLAGAAVLISNFQFAPKVVRIKAGAEVTWEVKEGTHTVTADEGGFESPALAAGKKFSHTFSKAGTYRYYCSFHGSKGGHDMAGTIIVSK